jgi:DNA-binding transcriptional LysR family regulator
MGFIPMIIDRMSRKYPKIAFQVIPAELLATRFRALRERSVDIMIGRILNMPLDDDLDSEVLFEDRYVVLAGSHSPWVRRRKIALEELIDEPWVLTPSVNPIQIDIAAGLQARGLSLPPVTVNTYSMHVRNYLLSTGRFLTVNWRSVLHFNAPGCTLTALPVDLGIPPRPAAVIKLKNRTLSPVVDLFIAQARELAKTMPRRGR